MVAAVWGRQLGSRDWLGPRRLWGMGRITRRPGKGRGSQPRRGGSDGVGVGGAAAAAGAREREEGPGGLPCGTRGAAAPWPGVAVPGGGPEPGRARQARDAALGARVARGCAARPARRRGGGTSRARARPGGGAEGGPREGAGIGESMGDQGG